MIEIVVFLAAFAFIIFGLLLSFSGNTVVDVEDTQELSDRYVPTQQTRKREDDSVQRRDVQEELIFAWEVTSHEQFFDRLNKIIAFDENAYWYNYNNGPTEKASDFNEENNKFRLQLKEIHKDIFKDGLFLVYNGYVVKETTDPFGMGPIKRLCGQLQNGIVGVGEEPQRRDKIRSQRRNFL